MSVRNLDKLFKPRSVALIGATPRSGAVGAVVARNLKRAGFTGRLMLVSPKHHSINGEPVYKDVASLPETPDLAVIATPPRTIPGIVGELGARGTRAAVVISAGFSELGAEGRQLEEKLLEAAQPHLLRVVGPNCVGMMVPGIGLDASFSHVPPLKGDLAFVSQSGAMITAVLDWTQPRGIGFSHVVSLGDMMDVDFGDMLDYLANDASTRAILLYVEGIKHARKFMSAARAAARHKPVLVVKVGRHAEGAKAAASHTGALAGMDAVYDAAFRRAGMLRLANMTEVFDAVETLALTRPQQGERLAILTNGGGPGVLATDTLIDLGGKLATLGPDTLKKLDAVLPKTWSHGNPVDIIGDAPGSRYAAALKTLLEDRDVDAVLVLNCPTALAKPADAAHAVIDTVKGMPSWQLMGRNVLTTWLGEKAANTGRKMFDAAHIATYSTPDRAVRGFMHRVQYRRNQELLMETPPIRRNGPPPQADLARATIARAVAAKQDWLEPQDVAAVLNAYGIPAPALRLVADADEAAAAAAEIGFPVAIKIRSPDILHKSDVGGVALNLGNPARVRAEAAAMIERVKAAKPQARVEGFLVQRMVTRPGALELIIGIMDDAAFGPVVLFGEGGTAVELVNDSTLELPPLNDVLARAMIGRTRISKLMHGYRGRPPVDMDGVVTVLERVAELAIEHPEIRELDINPLLADHEGVIAVDARIRVGAAKAGQSRVAISPYPKELESRGTLRDGTAVRFRPIRPEDEPLLQDVAEHMDPEDLRLRFFTPMKGLTHQLAARLSQIDYDREMALIALTEDDKTALGVVRYAADPDLRRAEYAIALRSDWKGKGLGYMMMNRLVEVARERGIGEITGEVLRENEPMLQMCRELGFALAVHPQEPELVHVKKPLGEANASAA